MGRPCGARQAGEPPGGRRRDRQSPISRVPPSAPFETEEAPGLTGRHSCLHGSSAGAPEFLQFF
jgi:hypothetical protein